MAPIITDPHFTTLGRPDSRWSILTHQGVIMAPTVQDSVLTLEISQTRGANWHGELRYSPFPVAVGETFMVEFSARAQTPFTFSVWLGQQNAPYQSLVSKENHFGEKMLTAEWQTFTHTWHPVVAEPEARLNFVLGQIDNTVEIKDVSLRLTLPPTAQA